jgi:uncharacterized membrane protein
MTSFFVNIAHAQSQNPPTAPFSTAGGIQTLLCSIMSYFFWFVIVISVIMILYAAWTYATAADDTEKTSKARRTITYAALAILVALIATQFPTIVSTLFPGYSGNVTTCSSNISGSSGPNGNGSTGYDL